MSDWIAVEERTPEEKDLTYQVVAVCKKRYGPDSCYSGKGMRGVYQDWVIRKWPNNFTHWFPLPDLTGE